VSVEHDEEAECRNCHLTAYRTKAFGWVHLGESTTPPCPQPRPIPREFPTTRWNGERCIAKRCLVEVADTNAFPQYWARYLVGQLVRAVEVNYNNHISYLYDEDGKGWYKVSNGGGPRLPHANLIIERVVEYYD